MATSWLQFDLGERSFAIPLDAVAEVMWAQQPRLIPLVPPNVGGVLNIRGEPLVVMMHVSRIDRDRAVWTGREENVNEEYPFVREVHRANGTLGLVDLTGFSSVRQRC